MNKYTLYRFVLVLGLLLTVNILIGQTLHVIMFICDQENDRIYLSCQRDKALVKGEARRIAHLTGLNVKFYPTSFTKESLHTVVSNLRVNNNDDIWFYYSGHGYNIGDSEFPCMNFDQPTESSPHISLLGTHERLKAKGARFTLTTGDLCNSLARSNWSHYLSGEESRLAYSKLFKQYSGDIIVCSSQKGQYSYGGVEGGYFTLSFLYAIQTAVNRKEYNWEYIIQLAKENTHQRMPGQNPYAEVNVRVVQHSNTFEP